LILETGPRRWCRSVKLKAQRLHYAWTILIVGVWVVFVSIGLARFGYGLLLPSMQEALGLDNTGSGILATVSLTGYLLFSLICGALSSRYGGRIVISLGLVLAGIGMLLTGAVGTFWAALLAITLVGLGSGATNVPVMALFSSWFGVRLRGLAAGIGVTGSSFAFILLGPLVPRFLTAVPDGGWRYTWYLFGGVSLICALAAFLLLRDAPLDRGLIPLGGETSTASQGSDGGSRSGWISMIRSSPVWYLGVLYTAFGFSYIIYTTFFIKYLVGERDLTRISAGGLYMLIGWFSLACGLLWSGLSDRIGRGWALFIVYLIQISAYSLFALSRERWGLTVSAALFGLTAWSAPAIVSAACGDLVGHRLAPAALGFVTIFFGVGQILGPVAAGMIADALGSFRVAFLLGAGVTLLGALGAPFMGASARRMRREDSW
jgi:sugar phosphate permease